jgi:hypothetical protein
VLTSISINNASQKKVIPKYANTKFQNSSPVAQFSFKKAQSTRIKDEIKFLYKKKENLNRELYERYLKAAKEWGKMWCSIQNHINEKLNQNMEKKYKTLGLKINKMDLLITGTIQDMA